MMNSNRKRGSKKLVDERIKAECSFGCTIYPESGIEGSLAEMYDKSYYDYDMRPMVPFTTKSDISVKNFNDATWFLYAIRRIVYIDPRIEVIILAVVSYDFMEEEMQEIKEIADRNGVDVRVIEIVELPVFIDESIFLGMNDKVVYCATRYETLARGVISKNVVPGIKEVKFYIEEIFEILDTSDKDLSPCYINSAHISNHRRLGPKERTAVVTNIMRGSNENTRTDWNKIGTRISFFEEVICNRIEKNGVCVICNLNSIYSTEEMYISESESSDRKSDLEKEEVEESKIDSDGGNDGIVTTYRTF